MQDNQKNKQWLAFLRKNALNPMPLASIINDLRELLLPVLIAAASGSSQDMDWQAGVGWKKNGYVLEPVSKR